MHNITKNIYQVNVLYHIKCIKLYLTGSVKDLISRIVIEVYGLQFLYKRQKEGIEKKQDN
jgi:hypothetical protein